VRYAAVLDAEELRRLVQTSDEEIYEAATELRFE
jgi:hypothetical protein